VLSLSLVTLFSVYLDDGIVNSGLMGGKGKCSPMSPGETRVEGCTKNLKKRFESQFRRCFNAIKRRYQVLQF